MTMTLKQLLKDIEPAQVIGTWTDYEIKAISCDSRTTQAGDLFVAVPGAAYDGAKFIPDVIAKGVKVIAAKEHSDLSKVSPDVLVLKIGDPRKFLLEVTRKFYDCPSRKVKTIGITGTNGKTTISFLLESILKAAGKTCGVMGTINHRIGSKIFPSRNTTPGLVENQVFLSELAAQEIDYCVMEVSSHALDQGRVQLIDFQTGIFTNLTREHLDYHNDMEAYFAAKAVLFKNLSDEASAVINIDDEYGPRFMKGSRGKVLTYGLTNRADVTAIYPTLELSGSRFTIQSPAGQIEVNTQLIGRHNVYNILAATGAALSQNIPLSDIKTGIEDLKNVPGRMELVDCGQDFAVFVDYAHTDDALHNVLMSLRNIRDVKIILVFGCGGNRDTGKRPKMGKVASELADWSILTNDNPRKEDPERIAREVAAGFRSEHYEVILDRKKAIHKALASAKAGEIVLIAGKGHEDYQIFGEQKTHFDDREVVREYFQSHPVKNR